MQWNRLTRFMGAISFALCLFAAHTANAQVYVVGSGGEFGTLNLSSGVFTSIATTTNTYYGIAFASDGTLYGVTSASQLYTIDRTTGTETSKGSIGSSGTDGLAYLNSTLYSMGTTQLAPNDDYLNKLSTTGTITPVGDMTVHTMGALAAGPSGSLYMTQQISQNPDLLYSLNTTSGTATSKGSIGYSGVYGMVYDNGTMYGFDSANDILNIDLSAGTGTKVGTISGTGAVIFLAHRYSCQQQILSIHLCQNRA